MATIRLPDAQTVSLQTNHLVGRSRACHTRLDDERVSSQHAAFRWTRDGWAVRDLGSRNGTQVNGQALLPGQLCLLHPGDVVLLGSSLALTFADAAPPVASAWTEGATVTGTAGLLALPSEDDPQALLVCDPQDGWVLMEDAGPAPCFDGQDVAVSGRTWRLSLPEPAVRTVEAQKGQPTLDEARLLLKVSADEEYVEATVEVRGQRRPLKPRAHHYLLLTLARARLADAEAASGEQGWLHSDDLARMLRVSSNALYVSTHRIRKEFDALGLIDGASIIERRAPSRQVRIGLGAVAIERL